MTPDDYISREAAKEAVYKTAEEYDEYDKCDRIAIIALNNADEILNNIPAADVVEVRHGQWILNDDESVAFCSECDCAIPTKWGKDMTWIYCPECGAKMGEAIRNQIED